MDQGPRLADFLALADGYLRAAAFRPDMSSGPQAVAAEIWLAADLRGVGGRERRTDRGPGCRGRDDGRA